MIYDLAILVHFKPYLIQNIVFSSFRKKILGVVFDSLPKYINNNFERPVDVLAEKHPWLTHSLSDNLKSRDARASKKDKGIYAGMTHVFR